MEICECVIKQEAKKIEKGIGNIENKQEVPTSSILHSPSSIFIQTPIKINPETSEEGHDFSKRLKEKNPDFLVVIAYGKIIPQSILDIPKIAAINVHGSLLPKYR